jgi:hypothetical protein
VEEALASTNDGIVLQALMVILSFGIALTRFEKTIARLALSKQTAIRKAAQRIVRSSQDMFILPLKEEIANAPHEEKLRGVRLFGRLYGSVEIDFCKGLLERETTNDIKKAISHILEINEKKNG